VIKNTAGVNDTGDYLIAGVNNMGWTLYDVSLVRDTCDKFVTRVVDTGDKFMTGVADTRNKHQDTNINVSVHINLKWL